LLCFSHGLVIVIVLAVNYHLCALSVTRSLSTNDVNSDGMLHWLAGGSVVSMLHKCGAVPL